MKKQLGYRGGVTKTKQVAIISDVGTNREALDKATKYLRDHDVDTILNCGNGKDYDESISQVWGKIMQDKHFISIAGAGDTIMKKILPSNRIVAIGDIKFLLTHESNGEEIEDFNEEHDIVIIGQAKEEAYVADYNGKVLITTTSLVKNGIMHIILIKIKNKAISFEFKHFK